MQKSEVNVREWNLIIDCGLRSYHHANGARVYPYTEGRGWGLQMSHESVGSGGFNTMREAMAHALQHSN